MSNPDPTDFAALLVQHARGRSHDDLTAALANVVRAVAATGKPGSLTYTVAIKPEKRVEGMVRIEDKIKTVVPLHDRPASMWFTDDDGRLSQDHPHQQAIFTVEGPR